MRQSEDVLVEDSLRLDEIRAMGSEDQDVEEDVKEGELIVEEVDDLNVVVKSKEEGGFDAEQEAGEAQHDKASVDDQNDDDVASESAELPREDECVAPVASPSEFLVQKRSAVCPSSRCTSFRHGMTRDERLKSMVNQAQGKARKDRLGEGLKSAFQANMDDIGALGIGMQLYFMLTKYLSVTFLCMGLISLPAIIVNIWGHGMTSKLVDPLQLAYSSIGNGGVNRDTAASGRNCLPLGEIDCTWETVTTPLTSNPRTVTWIVTMCDVVYSFVFVCFLLYYSYHARKVIKHYQSKHLTPARYAVMVRGLPRDATEKEILDHFNKLYDLDKVESYRKLWFGCCWGKRNKVRRSASAKAMNRNRVSNVDHLEGATTVNKDLYLNTWIAQVSVAHPTGGLLRTFLSMESLGQKKQEINLLLRTLEAEKSDSPAEFKASDENLLHFSRKKLVKVEARLEKERRKIRVIRKLLSGTEETQKKRHLKEEEATRLTRKEKLAAAAKAAKTAATNMHQAFNWEACERAFVVFNNLESQRRCLQDYRHSSRWLTRKWQPPELCFRAAIPLLVTCAPEPSNILWENLEVTQCGRFYRQSVTSLVTVMLLVISCAIISATKSTQDQFASKAPPEGLCDRALPAVYYADPSYSMTAQRKAISWSLAWDPYKVCPSSSSSTEPRSYISYTNGILNDLNTSRISYGPTYPNPKRCVDACISDSSSQVCHTLPCFYYNELVVAQGMTCQAYEASHVLSCFCSTQLANSINEYGFIRGPKKLWEIVPCRQFTTEYLVKNSFIVLAAGIVVLVNVLLNTILRMFAVFERHDSESTKTIRVAIRMFIAQFLNTAVIVTLMNASFGLSNVPVAKELLGGEYRDFYRAWYPSVGMGIATTMILNAIIPQVTLFVKMYLWAPFTRYRKRHSIRTQSKMDKLYAGPTFDMSLRYPMVLNSVFVTMVFCGGSPILLFIAAVASSGIYWFDKLSILHLYSVKTTYDETLGQVTLELLPWTLALHLGFSAWMYGNTDVLKGSMLNLPWLLKRLGLAAMLREHPNASSDELYDLLTARFAKYDVLGQYGLLAKIVYSHVMLMALLCVFVTIGLLLRVMFGRLVVTVLQHMVALVKQTLLLPIDVAQSLFRKDNGEVLDKETSTAPDKDTKPLTILPEFTEPYAMSVSRRYKSDKGLGFQKTKMDHTYVVTCVWPEDIVHENGIERVTNDPKLSWETMQAPVKSYAIEANEKYRLAVGHVSNAWELVKKTRSVTHSPERIALDKVTPMRQQEAQDTMENEVKRKEETVAPLEGTRLEDTTLVEVQEATKVAVDSEMNEHVAQAHEEDNQSTQEEEEEGKVID